LGEVNAQTLAQAAVDIMCMNHGIDVRHVLAIDPPHWILKYFITP